MGAWPGSNVLPRGRRWGVPHPSPCVGNKSGFSNRAHLVPTFTFGETEVYNQVLFHKDSCMYKFQNYFCQIFGFYLCVFYG